MWICVFNETDTRFLFMSGYGHDESAPTPNGLFATHFVGGRCIINNPFRIHSCNVRNVFVICVLHIRRVKVWFLRCKSMVFGVQKGGFCIAKVWFLFFECCVVAICSQCYRNLFAMFWQSVSNIFAIRSQCFGNPSAAVGDRFIVPAYTKTPTKWGKKMCVR